MNVKYYQHYFEYGDKDSQGQSIASWLNSFDDKGYVSAVNFVQVNVGYFTGVLAIIELATHDQ